MDHYYPNCARLSAPKDFLERLYLYELQKGIPTWAQALKNLLVGREDKEDKA